MTTGAEVVGAVREIGRFPVKSMLGESPPQVHVATTGIVGDRTHALRDVETGKIASAKDPRRWGQLLGFRAEVAGASVTITCPDGSVVGGGDDDVDVRLSAATGRDVQLCTASVAAEGGTYDYVWDVDGIAPDDIISGSQIGATDDGRPISAMPVAVMAPGTFQDVAPITIMTTAALAAMAAHHPDGTWSPVRFRSNLLFDVDGDDVVESDWVGRRVAIGEVVLTVTSPAPRCVMTTLPQQGLPRDRGILQTVARTNMLEFAGLGRWACLGVYADVVEPGDVAVGDEVRLLPPT